GERGAGAGALRRLGSDCRAHCCSPLRAARLEWLADGNGGARHHPRERNPLHLRQGAAQLPVGAGRHAARHRWCSRAAAAARHSGIGAGRGMPAPSPGAAHARRQGAARHHPESGRGAPHGHRCRARDRALLRGIDRVRRDRRHPHRAALQCLVRHGHALRHQGLCRRHRRRHHQRLGRSACRLLLWSARGIDSRAARLDLHPDPHLRRRHPGPRADAQRPPRYGGNPEGMSRAAPAAAAIVLAAALAGCFLGNGYQAYLIAMVGLTAMVGVGLNVLLGLTGQVSLGHAGFFALGAYVSAILSLKLGVDFWLALPLAAALAGAVGIVLALPALRVTGPYLAMVTIAFGFIVQSGIIEWKALTGGSNGIMNIAPPALFGHAFQTREVASLAVVMAAVLLLLFHRLEAGAWGRAMRAVRASEAASQSLGLNPVTLRITAFALSAAAAGLAGALFAPLSGFISPSGFTFFQSILFLLVVIIGGAGTTAGPLVGAAVVVLLPQLGARFAEYQLLFFGTVLLLVLWLAPEGIVGAIRRRVGRAGRSASTDGHIDIAGYLAAAERRSLVATRLAISFGGVRAVADVSLTAESGKVTSVIGPNGAGKSTLLSLLSGFYRPDAGAIALGDRRLAGLAAHAAARAGIARTFQTSQLFAGLSVSDNVLVALRGHRLGGFFPWASRRAERRLADSLLDFVGCVGASDRLSEDLPHVEKRLVEIARALAQRPSVLLLDEPAAGLGERDKARLAALLRRIAATGVAVVLVEHDMSLVMELSDRVVVLDAG